MEEISKKGDAATLSLKWLNWADSDYIAARQLLRSERMVQGVSLANTAVEKYLKSLHVLLEKEVPRGFQGHNVQNLYNNISLDIPRLKLNKEFLEFLFKAYKLRYPDDLEPGYNISLCITKVLTELDYSVFEIRKGFNIRKGKNKVTTPFDQFVEGNSEQLLDKNCYFGDHSREDFFKEVSGVYELRVLPDGNLLEITYLSDDIIDDRKFIVEALIPNN